MRKEKGVGSDSQNSCLARAAATPGGFRRLDPRLLGKVVRARPPFSPPSRAATAAETHPSQKSLACNMKQLFYVGPCEIFCRMSLLIVTVCQAYN